MNSQVLEVAGVLGFYVASRAQFLTNEINWQFDVTQTLHDFHSAILRCETEMCMIVSFALLDEMGHSQSFVAVLGLTSQVCVGSVPDEL